MITLTSSLQQILDEFVDLGTDYDPIDSIVVQDGTTIKVVWPDTSRVRLDISVMGVQAGEVVMKVPPVLDLEGGTNPNNPSAPPVIDTLTPNTIASGGAGFDLTIAGSGFVDPSNVYFGAAYGPGIVNSDIEIVFHVGPEAYASPGTGQVMVAGPTGAMSNSLLFDIT